MSKRKNSFASNPMMLFILTVLGAFFVLAICTFTVSAVAYSTGDPTAQINNGSLISSLVTAAICGFTVSKIRGEGGIGFSVLSSLSFVLILLIIKVSAHRGTLSVGIIVDQLCYMGVAAIFAFLGRKRVKTRRRH